MGIPISVIIPCYENPECLDLCLKSLTENQDNKNQVIVVLDGNPSVCIDVVNKYNVDVLPLVKNMGVMTAHNYGVYMADNSHILIVNDDNVFPRHWDTKLLKPMTIGGRLREEIVLAPNQIEPTTSIFKSFIIENFGRSPEMFEYDQFLEYEDGLSKKGMPEDHFSPFPYLKDCSCDGLLFPIFMSKRAYMAIGGFDPGYPAKSGAVADWDFFLKCELAGLRGVRYHGVHFYHFVSVVTTTESKIIQSEKEKNAFAYFKFKWGYYPPLNATTHSRFPHERMVKGIEYN